MYKAFKYAAAFAMFAVWGRFAFADAQLPPAPFVAQGGAAELASGVAESAKSALASGMPSLAAAILGENIARSPSLKESEAVAGAYVDALIALGDYRQAEPFLKLLKSDSAANKIRAALVRAGLGKNKLAMEAVAGVSADKVPPHLRAWLHLARGYALFESGDNAAALAELNQAKEFAKSARARADAEVAINILKLSAPDAAKNPAALEADLKQKVSLFMGTPEGFQFAKQYAALLFRLGRERDAVDVINQQLEISLAPEIDKEELNLISAAYAKDPEKQMSILEGVLRKTSSPDIARLAIEIVSANSRADSAKISDFLDGILKNSSVKIKDRILFECANAAIKAGARAKAVECAQKIVEEYPQSAHLADALRVLAWAAWGENPPQYRLAAANLAKLAELQETPRARDEIMYLVAACYFRDKDYASAAEIYARLFSTLAQKRGRILDRAVDSYLALGREADARKLIDGAYQNNSVSPDTLWRAEWKVIEYCRANGETQKAISRIDHALGVSGKISFLLKLRLMWLKASISERSRLYTQALEHCDAIIKMARAAPASEDVAQIAANTLLLRGLCLENLGGGENLKGAISAYEAVRASYPQTEAAPLSYLYQARAEAELGRYANAQELCGALAARASDPRYKYAASFEAAVYTQKIGTKAASNEALAKFDALCAEFPGDPRNFYARLWQADILRLLNSFADARKLYDELVNKYQGHPEIYLAWLRLGDCLLAQKKDSDAKSIYERLYSLSDVPLSAKAEAAFKWSFALRRAGRVTEANDVALRTSNALLGGGGGAARYWLGRSLLDMAQSLEQSGDKRDARQVYELIVKYKLPSHKAAASKLGILKNQ